MFRTRCLETLASAFASSDSEDTKSLLETPRDETTAPTFWRFRLPERPSTDVKYTKMLEDPHDQTATSASAPLSTPEETSVDEETESSLGTSDETTAQAASQRFNSSDRMAADGADEFGSPAKTDCTTEPRGESLLLDNSGPSASEQYYDSSGDGVVEADLNSVLPVCNGLTTKLGGGLMWWRNFKSSLSRCLDEVGNNKATGRNSSDSAALGPVMRYRRDYARHDATATSAAAAAAVGPPYRPPGEPVRTPGRHPLAVPSYYAPPPPTPPQRTSSAYGVQTIDVNGGRRYAQTQPGRSRHAVERQHSPGPRRRHHHATEPRRVNSPRPPPPPPPQHHRDLAKRARHHRVSPPPPPPPPRQHHRDLATRTRHHRVSSPPPPLPPPRRVEISCNLAMELDVNGSVVRRGPAPELRTPCYYYGNAAIAAAAAEDRRRRDAHRVYAAERAAAAAAAAAAKRAVKKPAGRPVPHQPAKFGTEFWAVGQEDGELECIQYVHFNDWV